MRRPESLVTYPEGLVDKHAAAAWLGKSVSWVEKAAASGEIPHTKVGGENRWSADHLAAIAAENEVQVWAYDTPRRGLHAV